MNKHLDAYISTDRGAPSLSPLDSDSIFNAIHVEQVVGTLVRMHSSGRYEGYLAASWHKSEDSKKWQFVLRSGLICEDGSPINARTFSESLIRIIRLINKSSQMPLMDRLQGFDKIHKSDSIDGVQALDDQTLEFTFTKAVEKGLLEYLALPYLGHYCENNFTKDGTWKDDKILISSASYKIERWDGQGPMNLRLREDWFRSVDRPFETVTIHTKKISADEAPTENGFIVNFNLEKTDIPKNYKVVNLSPTILHAIVISPVNNRWLQTTENRQLLRNEIKRVQAEITHPSEIESIVKSDRFYPHMSSAQFKQTATARNIEKVDVPFILSVIDKPSKTTNYVNQVIITALENMNVPYEIKIENSGHKDMMNSFRNQMRFDVRATSVDAGDGVENQLVKFMFCSNLGVSFPDPSKRIYQLTDSYEQRFGDLIPHEEMQKYITEYDRIIDEDAAVIPILKTGYSWLLSNNLSSESVSPTMGIPYFDLFNLNDYFPRNHTLF